jgi:hypothetical protein
VQPRLVWLFASPLEPGAAHAKVASWPGSEETRESSSCGALAHEVRRGVSGERAMMQGKIG